MEKILGYTSYKEFLEKTGISYQKAYLLQKAGKLKVYKFPLSDQRANYVKDEEVAELLNPVSS
jgi:hypothetical protein